MPPVVREILTVQLIQLRHNVRRIQDTSQEVGHQEDRKDRHQLSLVELH